MHNVLLKIDGAANLAMYPTQEAMRDAQLPAARCPEYFLHRRCGEGA